MTAVNIRKACNARGVRPVCDHNAYRDRYCYNSGKNLHFSHPSHDRQLGVPVSKMRYIFYYTGRHHTGSLYNTGSSHRWRNNNDRNKYTMCEGKALKAAKPKQGKPRYALRFKGNNFYKVKTVGVMNAANIRKACQANGMKPVCDYNNYKDRYCYVSGRNLHFSYPPHDRQLGVNVAAVRYTFFYTGRHGRGSLYNTGSTHRWMNNNDRNKNTMCMGSIPTVIYKGKKFFTVRVSGLMTAANIRKACNARGVRPVCDHNAYRDRYCYNSGKNLHFSHPSHDMQLGVPVS
jgi:translation elongation factor P/translation initiation factor 5A